MKRAHEAVSEHGSFGLVALAAVVTVTTLLTLFDIRTISGTSMVPSLFEGERVLVFRLAYGLRVPLFDRPPLLSWNSIRRGDLVVLSNPLSGNEMVKICAGIAGDLVSRSREGEWILVETTDEPGATAPPPQGAVRGTQSDLVPIDEGFIYVLGANPDRSIDSRHFGPVPVESVRGRIAGRRA